MRYLIDEPMFWISCWLFIIVIGIVGYNAVVPHDHYSERFETCMRHQLSNDKQAAVFQCQEFAKETK